MLKINKNLLDLTKATCNGIGQLWLKIKNVKKMIVIGLGRGNAVST